MTVESITCAITPSSVVVANKNQIGCDLGGEEVILSLESGIYYGLNEVGASIWKLIQEPKSVAEVREAIMNEYEVQLEPCERDVINLLKDLAKRNLISVSE